VTVLECVPNVSEGRDEHVLAALSRACGGALLDVHADGDHHRSVFTLAGPTTTTAIRDLALAVADHVDISHHDGAHPRLGALDVVPFVALDNDLPTSAARDAREFASWIAATLSVPVFLFGDADPGARSLPDARRDAFMTRAPDFGPVTSHPRLGAVAVGARPVLVAVNCELDRDDVAVARAVAHEVRDRDGGLPGVRALGFRLASRGVAQVSLNLVALERTGLQPACDAVRERARARGAEVTRVELVGLVPEAERARCDPEFLAWAGIGADQTIEARLRAARSAG
jgi:glutamate formiminotransferase